MRNIYRSLLLILAGATQRELARYVRYLKTENEILRGKLPARVLVTPRERHRCDLAARRIAPLRFATAELSKNVPIGSADAHPRPSSTVHLDPDEPPARRKQLSLDQFTGRSSAKKVRHRQIPDAQRGDLRIHGLLDQVRLLDQLPALSFKSCPAANVLEARCIGQLKAFRQELYRTSMIACPSRQDNHVAVQQYSVVPSSRFDIGERKGFPLRELCFS